MSQPLSNARIIAIILPSWVGDTVMATPGVRAMRSLLPNAKLIGVMRPGLDDVLRGTPWLDDMIVCDFKGLAGPWRVGKAIRSASADAVLLLPNSFRSALAARLSGAPIRIGYNREGRGWLLTHRVTTPSIKPISAVQYYATLTRFALGIHELNHRIELHCTTDELAHADKLLEGVGRPFIVLNPGANRVDKRWPPERFAAVADQLVSSHQVSVVVTGSPKESDILAAVIATAKTPITNLVARGVTLGSLKAVLKQAALLITNDTGPRHIAAALGTPVVTLFGPTDHRWTTLEGVNERILLAEPFLPEEWTADEHADICRVDRISISDVLAAAHVALSSLRTH